MPNFVYFAFPIPGLCKYTDMSVGQTLPGGSTPFTLENYKSDLLKPQSKLHFRLCIKDEFENVNCCTSGDDDALCSPSLEVD